MTAPGRSAAQAIDAIRRGWPVRIAGRDGSLDLLAVETATDATLAAFAADAIPDQLLSFERAETLKIVGQRAAAAPGAVRIAGEPDLPHAIAVADPARDLAMPMKGPFMARPLGASDAASAAIDLARHAGLLPSFFVRDSSPKPDADLVATDVAAIAAFADPARLVVAARAILPVAASETSEIVAFRNPDDPEAHIALIVGRRDAGPPLVRLHSECLTGDVLGSLKCDCGPQLAGALDRIAGAGWGVLLYLRQEGRSIGLVNKLRAYQLQDQGFDTVDANLRLGFPVEARDFTIAARMLDLLGIDRVRLLTNNPAKVARLEAAGIAVIERLPLSLASNRHNAAYLATKRDRTGHDL